MVLQYSMIRAQGVLNYIIVSRVLSLAPFPIFKFEDFHGALSISSPSKFYLLYDES